MTFYVPSRPTTVGSWETRPTCRYTSRERTTMPDRDPTSRLRAGLLLTVLVFATALHGEPGTLGYDPESDPATDLRAAVDKAQIRGSRILVVVGGEWCSWCHTLDRFVKANEEIHRLWERHFVTLKVHYDPETPNEECLGRFPTIEGYPHVFVLEEDGTLLHSQNTAHLEDGESYSPERMHAFLTRWAPGTRDGK